MRTNSYNGSCSVCGVPVPAGAGQLVGPPWKVKCIGCSGEVLNAPVPIVVTRDKSGEIVFTPSGRLNDKFDAYVAALREGGARYNGNANFAKVDKALACIAGLEKAGLLLQIHPEVSAILQAFAQQHKSTIAAAGARASKVDEVLRTRGLALYPFQRIGVEWLAARMRALLADDMGLGKTIQTLIAIPEGAPVLVVGPQSASGVWGDETPRWRPDLSFTAVTPKDFHWPAAGEMVFCSYGSMPAVEDIAKLAGMTVGTILIADESHKLKSFKTQRTKRFREIANRARQATGRVWLLTGSPLLNDPRELWTILQAAGLGDDAFGRYWSYCDAFHSTQDEYGKMTFGEASPEVAEKLRTVMLRRRKVDVLPDLPAKMYRTLPVSITKEWDAELEKCVEQLKLHIPSVYDWIRAGMAAYEIGAPKPGQTRPDPIISQQQIEAARNTLLDNRGIDFRTISHMRDLLAQAKIPALLNLVEEFEEQDEPLLVFSAHRSPIDTLSQREGWAVITGDIDGEKRQEIARDFQAGKYKGLGLTIEAGGTAITLTRASQVIFVDRTFTPTLNQQAEDRAARIGQTRGVVITSLVANHYLDKRLAEILETKELIITSSVEAASIPGEERPELPHGMAEVDFDKLQATAQETLKGLDAAKAEAQRIAAERAKNAEELRAKLLAEAEEKKKADKAKRNYERARAHAKTRGWIEGPDAPGRRGPESAAETWAAEGLEKLSALDPDRARDRNFVGFSKSDGYVGHWLTSEIHLGLTANQWKIAITLCRPYHRQIGPCPKTEPREPSCSADS